MCRLQPRQLGQQWQQLLTGLAVVLLVLVRQLLPGSQMVLLLGLLVVLLLVLLLVRGLLLVLVLPLQV